MIAQSRTLRNEDLIERSAEHVACTSMRVRIGGRGDKCVAVEFPDRPLIH
jgi:hypothetical protein